MSRRVFVHFRRMVFAGVAAGITMLPYPALCKQTDQSVELAAPVPAAEALKPGDVAVLPVKSGKVKMTVVTADGFVSFTVPKDWRIGVMQSKPPVTQTVFQIRNPADEGTSHSTNLVISLIEPESDKAGAVIARIGKKFGTGEVAEATHKTWHIWTQEADQDGILYSVIDARRDVADHVAWARIAWPHLKNNAPGYDKRMVASFNTLLDSLSGKSVPYHLQPAEIFRRPE